jgi:hypothetical protein
MKARPRHWLLIKHRDEEARAKGEVAAQWKTSVVSGRTIDDLTREAEIGRLKTYRCGT